ncbi:P-loop containing nucleoside triphosphate hydrolase protein [Xylona heveae TC161]|uniref:RNA helicase n=1 Tax=Xylona heveae (strain CBS 132557 / TC161) TaxID=1328760 RepID=A0A165FVZ9_XYLHT|nr:P-loop containing nucleoside triphosphate hydrolase protein [Xylona heveae TC161]KZF21446.1 P-loop containing nucleoside triphosphate hydrolase protein [Xylona heveae TC161]
MAPNKKKKKPAANPARGFATVSTASKPKTDKKSESASLSEADSTPAVLTPLSDQENISKPDAANASKAKDAKETVELSPEELERELEETELQNILEKYGQRAKKDASRQISRLQTDRRVLKTQAEHLNTRNWLPNRIIDEIMNMVKDEVDHGNFYRESDGSGKFISEEDSIARLWTLQQTLFFLGFPEGRVKEALYHITDALLIAGPPAGGNRDNIWGLDEAMDWLVLELNREELSLIEGQPKRQTMDKTPTESIPQTPEPTTSSNEATGKQTPMTREKTQNANELVSSRTEELDVSDLDSDIEPDELLPKYLETKARIYELQPETLQVNNTKGKKNKAKKDKTNPSGPEVIKLLDKLKKIESDVLFDKDEAETQWSQREIQIFQEVALQKKLAPKDVEGQVSEAEQDPQQQEQVNSSENLDEEDEVSRQAREAGEALLRETGMEEDGDGLFGGMFTDLAGAENGPNSTTSEPAMGVAGVGNTIMRDFGRWNGMSPRRVLEDACKARDSGSRVSFKPISSSSVSKRHSVEIFWSKDQETPVYSILDSVSSTSKSRLSAFWMTTLATPDSVQSEAFIATAALFLVFSSSPKEERVHLRLPATWRDLWDEFTRKKKELNDEQDRNALREIRELVRDKRDRDEHDGVVLKGGFRKRNVAGSGRDSGEDSDPNALDQSNLDSELLKGLWNQKSSNPAYQVMLKGRSQLPMWNFRDQLLTTADQQQVIIVCGETGCGKSTQVPAFILEHELSQGKDCRIYCTEPRRISAISLARRVSEELGERRNDVGTSRSMVGYAIRLESNMTTQTRLVYATTGIVMRMLERSNELADITHLILDEVHERSIDSDFLLIVLRRLIVKRPELKVILMSATADAQRFSNYLFGAPILNVPGRTFPVEVKYLEDALQLTGYVPSSINANGPIEVGLDDADTEEISDRENTGQEGDYLSAFSSKTRTALAQFDEYRIDYDLLAALIGRIAVDPEFEFYSKAILIFLPGIAEIRQLNDMLIGHPSLSQGWNIHQLHSTIASEEQEKAFVVPPKGTRKIVLATNIAETGITIPDITCVIDTGKHKEMRFDERRQLSRLLDSFISRANAKQRRGRAGRVQRGLCFHLFTKSRHDRQMAEQQTPEMLRLSLQDLVLRVKICELGGIEQTLSEALDPPSAKNIRRAIDSLIDVKALTNFEELTPLGRQLAKLPLDVHLGKLVLLGSTFGCLDVCATIAAILSSKSPFVVTMGARSQADLARLSFKRGDSDLLTAYNAYNAWRRVSSTTGVSEFQFCRKNCLSQQTLFNIEDIKSQILASVIDAGFLQLDGTSRAALNRSRFSSKQRQFFKLPESVDKNSENDLISGSVIAWGFYPKLLLREGKGWRNVSNNQTVSLHPTSVNKGTTSAKWVSFYHIMQSSNRFYNAHETSAVESFAIALLCGDAEFRMYAGLVILDGNRIRFSVNDWKAMLAIKILRQRLREIMARRYQHPTKSLTSPQQKWLDIWQQVFALDDKENSLPK